MELAYLAIATQETGSCDIAKRESPSAEPMGISQRRGFHMTPWRWGRASLRSGDQTVWCKRCPIIFGTSGASDPEACDAVGPVETRDSAEQGEVGALF